MGQDQGNRDDSNPGPFDKTVQITPCAGRVLGTVTDDTGHPLGAQVRLGEGETTETNPNNGTYAFYMAAPGDYIVRVTAAGYQDAQQQATVAKGQHVQVNFALQTDPMEPPGGGEDPPPGGEG